MAFDPQVKAVQEKLAALGYDPGPVDGWWGDRTAKATLSALETADAQTTVAAPTAPKGVVPPTWMPAAKMDRIICHWTAGSHKASSLDKDHYHLLIEGDGKVVRGTPSIDLNSQPKMKTGYAAHTLNCNTGSIGVSLCCMAGAEESPFYPMTEAQWEMLSSVVAELCMRYDIPVTHRTVLSHAEVQDNLGIQQRGKIDIIALPFDPAFPRGAKVVGDRLRKEVSAKLAAIQEALAK
jgi:hypothetical protein